jgi:hypothetical protein
MGTLQEYFETDFPHTCKLHCSISYPTEKLTTFEIEVRLNIELHAHARFISCLIPECKNPASYILDILGRTQSIIDLAKNHIGIERGSSWDKRTYKAKDFLFTKHIYIYTVSDIPENIADNLFEFATQQDLSIEIRGQKYAMEVSKAQKPLAFISHDSRDKEQIARKIAQGLSEKMCPVWYDEYSLKIGDRLRKSIEKGLKECKKCILILSPNFLSNDGWTKTEFDSIFTRELIEKQDCILPVWYGVTKEQVYEYSPSLADRLGARWDLGEDEVIRQLHRAIL